MALKGFEPLSATFKMGRELLPDEAADEFLQLGFCDKVITTCTSDVNYPHGPQRAEDLEALAGGALADLETGKNFVKGEGLRRNVEETVNLSNRFG